jgi:hypothetical protein
VTTYIKNYRFTVATDKGIVRTNESEHPSLFSAMLALSEEDGISKTVLDNLNEGQTASLGINVKIECLVNRIKPRSPRRPHEVVQQEKEARRLRVEAKARIDREHQAKWHAEQERLKKLKRKRIANQIDHAFQSGHSGSGPVETFITCSHCDGPAALLALSRPIPIGATVLDESTITDARCSEHENTYPRSVNKVLCADLEFLYEGIRQIAIKAKANL